MNDIHEDEITPVINFDNAPTDLLITTDEWDHVKYLIHQNIKDCDYEEAGEYFLKTGLPFLSFFRRAIIAGLIKRGFKADKINDENELNILMYVIENEQGKDFPGHRWDINPPSGFPKGTYTVSKGKHHMWIEPEIEAALLTLRSIKKLHDLLIKDAVVDTGAVKVYLRTFELAINILRSGLLPKMAQMGEKHHITNTQKRKKRRTWNGQTPQERAERNKRIRESYARTDLTLNSFAINEARKQKLSPSTIKKIIKSQVDT